MSKKLKMCLRFKWIHPVRLHLAVFPHTSQKQNGHKVVTESLESWKMESFALVTRKNKTGIAFFFFVWSGNGRAPRCFSVKLPSLSNLPSSMRVQNKTPICTLQLVLLRKPEKTKNPASESVLLGRFPLVLNVNWKNKNGRFQLGFDVQHFVT